jgi:lipid-A-disaccharide synthase
VKPVSRRIFIVAGEHSGDLLGGKLMAALKERSFLPLIFSGVGGETMANEGLKSLFPLSDVTVMGLTAILARLPRLVRRVYQTVRAAIDFDPDVVIIIDSPDFTHPIAKRIRKRKPETPIVNYVSPTVWAWRPGRAKKMRHYVDHLLALLPFEPAAHQRLGGPACTYVGHPLIERRNWIMGLDGQELGARLGLDPAKPVVAVLPGSRPSEVRRLMEPFGKALGALVEKIGPVEVVLPVVASVRKLIEAELPSWPVQPHLVEGDEDKFRAFRLARVALAASGTVTLELALSGTPMVVAYRVDGLAVHLRHLVNVQSVVLANLVLGENVFPELLQEDCVPEKLAAALAPLVEGGPERHRQLAGLERIAGVMTPEHGDAPSERAAAVVLHVMDEGRSKRQRMRQTS